MRRFILFLLGFFGTSNVIFAQAIQQDKMDVRKVLQLYSEVTACETSFDEGLSLNDIFLIKKDEEDTTYFVYWKADLGCRGGSGTISFFVSEVAYYNHPPFLVRNNSAFGDEVDQQISSGYITKVTQVDKNHFLILTLKHDESDLPNFPSLLYQYEVKRESSYDEWKIVHSKFIKKQE